MRKFLHWALILLLLGAAGCDTGRRHTSPEVLAFWDRFSATNSAWLDPAPPAFSYELTLQRKEPAPGNQDFPWQDAGTLRVWCTPEKNLRVFHEDLVGPRLRRTNEWRYFHGRGDEVQLKPRGKLRDLGFELWSGGRTGAGFLSYLHLCAACGLPDGASLREGPDGLQVLTITNAPAALAASHREPGLSPAYSVHPVLFGARNVTWPETTEITIHRDSWLPAKIVEIEKTGKTLAEITFPGPWLEMGGRKVPGLIQCKLPTYGYDLSYEFTVEQGVWIIKEFTQESTTYSLCRKSRLAAMKVAPIPDAQFPSPADVAIPEQSATRLAPGERRVRVRTADGLSLEGKLSLPPEVRGPVPTVFFLPGAGPFTFDRPLVYPDLSKQDELFPPMKTYSYYDFFARELTARGFGLFRMNKRGCGIVLDAEGLPREICNRTIFSKATPSVLLTDYQNALAELRRQPGVDPNRIILLGASEGTRLAVRLAAAAPPGVRAVAMMGYAGDNTHNTLVWQHTVGPWRNVAKLFDENNDGRIVRAEYDAAVSRSGKLLMDALPFEQLDRDHNGTITPQEMNHGAQLDLVLKAVRERDDDFLWDNLLQLSSAYLLEDWEAAPLHHELLTLDLPLAVFHGEDDGTCRVEAVREAQQAFQRASRTNLSVRTYPKTDHNLNWTRFLRDGTTPEAFEDLFEFIQAQGQ